LLLVNKRDRKFDVTISGAAGARVDYVDQTTGFEPPALTKIETDKIVLKGFEVAVVTMPCILLGPATQVPALIQQDAAARPVEVNSLH
jgi:hypothetical protein